MLHHHFDQGLLLCVFVLASIVDRTHLSEFDPFRLELLKFSLDIDSFRKSFSARLIRHPFIKMQFSLLHVLTGSPVMLNQVFPELAIIIRSQVFDGKQSLSSAPHRNHIYHPSPFPLSPFCVPCNFPKTRFSRLQDGILLRRIVRNCFKNFFTMFFKLVFIDSVISLYHGQFVSPNLVANFRSELHSKIPRNRFLKFNPFDFPRLSVKLNGFFLHVFNAIFFSLWHGDR